MEKNDIAEGILHKVPEDMIKALKAVAGIPERWNSLTPIQRNEWICWVTHVKKSGNERETYSTHAGRAGRRQTHALLLARMSAPQACRKKMV